MAVTAPERASSLPERLRAAQQVLATAEATAGLRTVLPRHDPGRATAPPDAPDVVGADMVAPGALPAGEQSLPQGPGTVPVEVGDRVLAVPDALAPALPLGGLRRGSAVRVEGSTSLLLSMAAAACRGGAWCAVVGMPDLGLAAAAERGLPMDRVALVPSPGANTPAVLGAVIDGFDVVVLGDVPHLVERDRRQLASRLRHREALLLTDGAWPGVDVVLTVIGSRWAGIGQGHGSFLGHELTVRVGGRGAASGRAVRATLRSPDGVRLVPGRGRGELGDRRAAGKDAGTGPAGTAGTTAGVGAGTALPDPGVDLARLAG